MKDYCENLLGKSIDLLQYDDLENFFKEDRKETTNLEFKSYHPKNEQPKNEFKNTVLKPISAMLNSEGGIIIWGAPKKNNKDGVESYIGDLTPLNDKIEEETLNSIVADNINPMPTGFKIRVKEKNEKYLYVIQIEQSEYAPHQLKGTYYAKLDGITKPAPHYLVDALVKKQSQVKLLSFINSNENFYYNDTDKIKIPFDIVIGNLSKSRNAHNVFFKLFINIGKVNIEKINLKKYDPALKKYEIEKKRLSYGIPILDYFDVIIDKRDLLLLKRKKLEIRSYLVSDESYVIYSEYQINFKFDSLGEKLEDTKTQTVKENEKVVDMLEGKNDIDLLKAKIGLPTPKDPEQSS